MSADLRRVLMTADHCHGIVVRDGIEDACGKPPVAIIDGRGTEAETYWPACAYHANRYGRGKCVPLADLAALVTEARRIERMAAVMYGNPDGWCRSGGMNRTYWRNAARKSEGES